MPLLNCCIYYFNTSHVSINPSSEGTSEPYRSISIHLMFLLIDPCTEQRPVAWYFNTSHVSINPHLPFQRQDSEIISIHLMFLLILPVLTNVKTSCQISIHLMFLLIRRSTTSGSGREHFNTSHVSINLAATSFGVRNFSISIHLMFLLIYNSAIMQRMKEIFQYISCFY